MKTLLSTTFFGPVQWYQKLYHSETVEIEQWESFVKQSYRNRCLIATTQGIQALTVPVEHNSKFKIKDVRISDHGNWRHLHWNALTSAYNESPFFEYYQDDIRLFYEKKWDYLVDFNETIRVKICELIDIHPKVSFSSEFFAGTSAKRLSTYGAQESGRAERRVESLLFKDFRETIRPKHPVPDPDFRPKPYYQVYQQKYGFLPNLSILDLLFNMGPESIFYL